MSRSTKHYHRLEELEREYSSLLKAELSNEMNSASIYLSRKIPFMLDNKAWQTQSVGHIEKIEKDIISLRRKLGEPLSGSPVSLMQEYVKRLDALKDKLDGGKKSLAREMFARLEEGGASEQVAAADGPPGRR